jgi:hypothetical protein
MSARGLFGGAIVGDLSVNFSDASNFRQVPDNQEVFVDGDVSIIIELLEQETSVSGLPAIQYHFRELAESNAATEMTVISEADLSNDAFAPKIIDVSSKLALTGKQTVGKFRDRPGVKADDVYIVLVLIRLGSVATDMLISLNMPNLPLGEASAELTVNKLLYGDEAGSVGLADTYMNVLRNFVNTLEVKDWSLFSAAST